MREFLRRGFAVYSHDHLGHGRSDNRFGTFTFDALVGDTAALVQAAPPARTVLVGESMGGNVSVQVALRAPDTVTAVALIAPMLIISEKVKPPAFVIPVLKLAAGLFTEAAVIKSVVDNVFKEEKGAPRVTAIAIVPQRFFASHCVHTHTV